MASSAFAGGIASGSSNAEPASEVVAEHSGDGTRAAAVEIVYKVISKDSSVPGAIAVYANPTGVKDTADRVFINRIFPFAPPAPDGTRHAIVQVPENLAQQLGGDKDTVLVELVFDADLTAGLRHGDDLSLEKATIINEQ